MVDFFAIYASYWPEWWPRLLPAAVNTALLTLGSFLVALLLGGLVTAARRSGFGWIRGAGHLYVEIVRGVPVLAIIFLIYFGLPGIGVTFDSMTAGILGLGIAGSGYLAEVFRAGLAAIPRGQTEAALTSGLRPAQIYRYILLPQILRISLPPTLATLIALLKDSSLCSLIAADDLMLSGRAMSSEYFLPMNIYVMIGLFYFAIAWPLSIASRRIERRLSRNLRPAA